MYCIYPFLEKPMYVLIEIIIYYFWLKLIYKEKANLMDIFYITYFILLYGVLKLIIINDFIEKGIIIIFSILCKLCQNKLKKMNIKIINMWNGEDDKALTIRCIFLITFNISVYFICKII